MIQDLENRRQIDLISSLRLKDQLHQCLQIVLGQLEKKREQHLEDIIWHALNPANTLFGRLGNNATTASTPFGFRQGWPSGNNSPTKADFLGRLPANSHYPVVAKILLKVRKRPEESRTSFEFGWLGRVRHVGEEVQLVGAVGKKRKANEWKIWERNSKR